MPAPYLEFKPTVAKTADYKLTNRDHGKIFTNLGAGGAVNFTLPAIADVWDGWSCDFFVVADQTLTVTAPADKLVAFNDPVATSIAFSTAGEKVGGGVTIVFSEGAGKYLAIVHLAIETQTPVVGA